MSQERKSPQINSSKEAELLANDIEKMSPKEQQALLKSLQSELQAETSSEAAPLLEFVLQNIQKIILILAIIIIFIAGWGFWQWKQDSDLAAAKLEFQKIVDIQNNTQKLAQLQTFSVNAPKELLVAAYMEEAVVATNIKNYDFAAQKIRDIIALEKANSPLTISLKFTLADILLTDNKASQALEVLEELLPTIPEKLETTLIEEIALTAEIAGNKERAISAYHQLLSKNELELYEGYAYYLERLEQLQK